MGLNPGCSLGLEVTGQKEFLSQWSQMPKVRCSRHQKIAEGSPFLPQWQNQAGLGSLCQRGGSGQRTSLFIKVYVVFQARPVPPFDPRV